MHLISTEAKTVKLALLNMAFFPFPSTRTLMHFYLKCFLDFVLKKRTLTHIKRNLYSKVNLFNASKANWKQNFRVV